MMAPLDLEAGGQRLNLTLAKDSRAMISYKLFSYFEALGLIIWEIQVLFSLMTSLNHEAGVKGQIQHLLKISRP